jgi:aspartate kinase
MASQGAKVLQEQSVDYAMKRNVVVRVASSFLDNGGTIISSAAPASPFCGIAVTHNLSQIKVNYKEEKNFSKLLTILEKNLIHAEVFKNNDLCKANIMIDNKKTAEVINILKNYDFITKVKQEIVRRNFSKISVIGSSVCEDVGHELTKELKNKKIGMFGCSTKQYRANLIIPSDQLLNAVSILHKYCGLDK